MSSPFLTVAIRLQRADSVEASYDMHDDAFRWVHIVSRLSSFQDMS
jgi:hypothetical protein